VSHSQQETKYDHDWEPIEEPVSDDAMARAFARAAAASICSDPPASAKRNPTWAMIPAPSHRKPRAARQPGHTEKARPIGQPRAYAVMANSVHSIQHRKTSLIRRPATDVVPAICSLNAMRVLMHMLFHINAVRDIGFAELTSTVPALGRALGLRYPMGRRQAEDLLKEVASAILIVRKESTFAAIPVTALAHLDHETGITRLKLNTELEPYLLDLKNRFRKLHPAVLDLQSVRAVLLYIFLRRFIGLLKRRHRVPLGDLLGAMQVRVDIPWAEFRKGHLQPSINEINGKTEINVTCAPERGGRTDRKRGEVEAVIFEVAERKGAAADKEASVLLIPPRKAPGVTT
jgi:Initiator Replication protein